MKVSIKRVYDEPDKKKEFRILVDRLWPRGLSKEKAQVDLWLKELAPTTDLRKWFDHDPEKWKEFQRRYKKELEKADEAVATLKEKIKEKSVCLVYAAKDETHNNAVVIQDFLKK